MIQLQPVSPCWLLSDGRRPAIDSPIGRSFVIRYGRCLVMSPPSPISILSASCNFGSHFPTPVSYSNEAQTPGCNSRQPPQQPTAAIFAKSKALTSLPWRRRRRCPGGDHDPRTADFNHFFSRQKNRKRIHLFRQRRSILCAVAIIQHCQSTSLISNQTTD